MADSMENHKRNGVHHTLKRCDEITESFLKHRDNRNWFDVDLEPHLIEIRTDDVANDHVESSEEEKVADLQRYDIVKFLERTTGEVVSEKTVIFNVPRKEKDMLLASILKPKLVKKSGDHDDANHLKKRYRAVPTK